MAKSIILEALEEAIGKYVLDLDPSLLKVSKPNPKVPFEEVIGYNVGEGEGRLVGERLVGGRGERGRGQGGPRGTPPATTGRPNLFGALAPPFFLIFLKTLLGPITSSLRLLALPQLPSAGPQFFVSFPPSPSHEQQ